MLVRTIPYTTPEEFALLKPKRPVSLSSAELKKLPCGSSAPEKIDLQLSDLPTVVIDCETLDGWVCTKLSVPLPVCHFTLNYAGDSCWLGSNQTAAVISFRAPTNSTHQLVMEAMASMTRFRDSWFVAIDFLSRGYPSGVEVYAEVFAASIRTPELDCSCAGLTEGVKNSRTEVDRRSGMQDNHLILHNAFGSSGLCKVSV
jgi:hypothetical protein